jgi:hypothetical protein
MDQTLETLLNEMKKEIDKWMAYISDKNAENIVKRTSLQIGIHDYALLEYNKGRVSMTDDELDLSMPLDRRAPGDPLTEELVREHIVPELSSYMHDEHQSVQNHFTIAFTERHGVNTETIPTLVKCILHCNDSMKMKIQSDMEHGLNVRLLLDQVRDLPYYQVERIVYLIWGGTDKLRKIAAKAEGERAQWLSELAEAARRK